MEPARNCEKTVGFRERKPFFTSSLSPLSSHKPLSLEQAPRTSVGPVVHSTPHIGLSPSAPSARPQPLSAPSKKVQRRAPSVVTHAESAAGGRSGNGASPTDDGPKFLGVYHSTWKKVIPLGAMFFCELLSAPHLFAVQPYSSASSASFSL